jgi:hypothetical protein
MVRRRKTKTHGGKRTAGQGKAIGRPREPGAKIPYGTKLQPLVVHYLWDCAAGNKRGECESAVVTIEKAIMGTAIFKRWEASEEAD